MEKKNKVRIYKRDNDQLAIRISMGCGRLDPNSAYIVYRGNINEVKKLFGRLYEAILKLKDEAELDPRDINKN